MGFTLLTFTPRSGVVLVNSMIARQTLTLHIEVAVSDADRTVPTRHETARVPALVKQADLIGPTVVVSFTF